LPSQAAAPVLEAGPEEEEPAIITVWTLVRFVHVLSAMVWVGGQLLLSLLVLPVLRRRLDAAVRAPLTREVGVRFGIFTVAVFLPVQVATGIALAAHRGLTVRDLAEPGYGRILGEKVTLFALVLLISGVHGVAVRRGQDRPARPLAIATLVGSVGVVLLATALVP
jgi:putative copper export protein